MKKEQRLLVVDDDASVLDAMTKLLAAEGYEVLAARDGAEALVEKPIDVTRCSDMAGHINKQNFAVARSTRVAPPPTIPKRNSRQNSALEIMLVYLLL